MKVRRFEGGAYALVPSREIHQILDVNDEIVHGTISSIYKLFLRVRCHLVLIIGSRSLFR